MHPTTRSFPANAKTALSDAALQRALSGLPTGLVAQRARARERLPEFEALREDGKRIRDHALEHLDLYLQAFEEKATAAGTHVHWAATADDARSIILDICRRSSAKLVTKGKSMVSEEIGLNRHLIAAGLDVVETDLGEYILQIRDEAPSHIVAPVIHLTQDEIEADFRRAHAHLDERRDLTQPAALVDEARTLLRHKFLTADVGITGANFLIAETGSTVIVTNEGNGDLTQSCARVHIIITSIDRVLPTLEDASTILRLLARSATGQEITTYTTFSTGPRRADDPDGPEQCHVVVLDNGRSELLASEQRAVLRCIRCAACMNHCPVYNSIGGHAYGWVYPGPIGAVLTPGLLGIRDTGHLPGASTFCGRCEAVCPMKIPLPDLMRNWREREFDLASGSWRARLALRGWAWLAARPRLYHLAMRFAAPLLKAAALGRNRLSWLPLASGWTRHRDLATPQGRTFQQLWSETQKGAPR